MSDEKDDVAKRRNDQEFMLLDKVKRVDQEKDLDHDYDQSYDQDSSGYVIDYEQVLK